MEIHGFCDASMKAYGAVVYVRSISNEGKVTSRLAAGKSRVAPIKVVTLPRLELCAAVLLTDLVKQVLISLKHNFNKILYYTDSTIVLSWLNLDPATLKIFVANRVSHIQSYSNIEDWNHVRSEENPADMLSRGMSGKELIDNKFWFSGPHF